MEQLTAEINKVSAKIDAIEELLKKSFKTWTEEEINLYGIEEQEARKQLRKKEEQLRDNEQELLKQKTIILQRGQNQGILTAGTAASQGIVQQSTKTTSKFIYSSGPVDPKINYSIPFDMLPWAMELINAVDSKQAIFWQSGKTSALRFIKSRAEEQGIKVYYLDMMASNSTLERYVLDGRSIFQFLAWQ
jgi:hypothetical protein